MSELDRPPSKLERVAAAVASGMLALIFGIIVVFVWRTSPDAVASLIIFSVLGLASAILFCRAAFTARRRLSHREASNLARVMQLLGCISVALALLVGSGGNRLLLLGSGLSCVAAGFAGAGRRGR